MTTFLYRFKQRKLVQWALAYVAFAFALLQGLDVIAQQFGWPHAVQRGITLVLALGFFVTLLLAWYHGERGMQKVSGTELLILAMLLAVGGGLLWRFAPGSPTVHLATSHALPKPVVGKVAPVPAVDPKSIAVLPFTSMSPGQDNTYFAEGLSEEIINSLSRVPDLAVAARTSSFALGGSHLTVPQIAARLHVATVLEGSVRRGGEKLRISAQLVRASDGFELWSDTYDRGSKDVIAIQEDVARQIALALKTATDPRALAAMQRAGTRSVKAYQVYLRGLAIWNDAMREVNSDKMLGARRVFEQAIRIDPQFVDAYANLASLQLELLRPTDYMAPRMDASYRVRLQRARGDLGRAAILARNETNKDYYAALRASLDQQYVEAIRLMSMYVRTYPNHQDALMYLGTWSLNIGDDAQARYWLQRLAGTQLSERMANAPEFLMVMAGDYALAEKVARRRMHAYPDDLGILYQAHRALLSAGKAMEASQLLSRLMSSNAPGPEKFLPRLRQACAEGRAADAGKLYAQYLAQGASRVTQRWLALQLLGRGKEAARLLEPLDQSGDLHALAAYLAYPQFDVAQYPHLEAELVAQGIHRPPVRHMPYACKAGDDS